MTKLNQLAEIGVNLSIDDIGTGYSSLSYLKRFPIDQLKIDRSFIKDLPFEPSDVAIVRAIVGLGRTLGLRVVAEGIETRDQWQFLREAGCDTAQGYLFSRPLAAANYPRFFKAHPPLPADEGNVLIGHFINRN